MGEVADAFHTMKAGMGFGGRFRILEFKSAREVKYMVKQIVTKHSIAKKLVKIEE